MFPMEGIWKVEALSEVALWTASHNKIITIDNLIKMYKTNANKSSLCIVDAESKPELRIHCEAERD